MSTYRTDLSYWTGSNWCWIEGNNILFLCILFSHCSSGCKNKRQFNLMKTNILVRQKRRTENQMIPIKNVFDSQSTLTEISERMETLSIDVLTTNCISSTNSNADGLSVRQTAQTQCNLFSPIQLWWNAKSFHSIKWAFHWQLSFDDGLCYFSNILTKKKILMRANFNFRAQMCHVLWYSEYIFNQWK